jgi:hypothetical protein
VNLADEQDEGRSFPDDVDSVDMTDHDAAERISRAAGNLSPERVAALIPRVYVSFGDDRLGDYEVIFGPYFNVEVKAGRIIVTGPGEVDALAECVLFGGVDSTCLATAEGDCWRVNDGTGDGGTLYGTVVIHTTPPTARKPKGK